MRKRYAVSLLAVTAALLVGPSTGGSAPVATSAEAYQLCGRVFPDPQCVLALDADTFRIVLGDGYAAGGVLLKGKVEVTGGLVALNP